MSYIGNTPSQVAFVTDSFSGNGSTTAFTMSVAPANTASVLVAVSGVLQDPSTYSVSGTTLTFTGAPPTGTGNISVRYLGIPASGVTTTAYRTVTEFTATAGQTTFTPPSYTVGFINVYNNGVRLGSADYTATNGTTVVLTTGAVLNDLVTVESYYVSSVLNAIPATAGSVNSTYIAAGAALANIGAGGVTQSYLGSNVAGTGPAFSAYNSTNQSISNNVSTKAVLNSTYFNVGSAWDTTNNWFKPTVAGYYQLNFQIGNGTASYYKICSIRKNGTTLFSGSRTDAASGYTSVGNTVVYLNGSTDYIELYGYVGAGSSLDSPLSNDTCTLFSGFLARAA